MTGPSADDFYRPWERTIAGWPHFQESVYELAVRYPNQRLLWRGARDAGWGVESSLYRQLTTHRGRAPREEDMVEAERRILALARETWRFDGMGALETFAHLQHLGGPTRLLDVTENPLIAAWFATERESGGDETDSRLFAFVTPGRDIRLNSRWGGRDPHWHAVSNASEDQRRLHRWGTGTGRRYWRPPAYDARISSQSAGFLLDGVPIRAAENGFGRKGPDTEETWSSDDMRKFGSIPLKLTTIRRGELRATAAPVFTFRIAADARANILDQLERRYGYNAAAMYSDLYGLARYLTARPDRWADPS
ncbi:MAG: FRG domain-containing protein [Micrococcales bacterium]|nr:FRG domain-containing protein [Micrococcales bacterium]